jgi:hypothetical protein
MEVSVSLLFYTQGKGVKQMKIIPRITDEGKTVKDYEAHSIIEVDMSRLKIPVVAIYDHPDDYPDICIARVYDLEQPTNVILQRVTARELIDHIQMNTRMYFMKRGAGDVPCLVGAFM